MKTKCKAFVIQPLGTGSQEAGPAVSHYNGMLSDGYTGGKIPHSLYSLTHSAFRGMMLGKVGRVNYPEGPNRVEQVMGEVELVSAKSTQGCST